MSGSIYTRGGDSGETSLVGGGRTSKASARVEAYGTIDEANSAIGLARVAVRACAAADADPVLGFAQHRLMNCSSRVATPAEALTASTPAITSDDIDFLEESIDKMLAEASDQIGFVLPGGADSAARLHVARTVTRRAERRLVELSHAEDVDPEVMKFINRLSDLLFAAARYANTVCGANDECWDSEYRR